ncbi:MAG TPA: hypothetical protein VGH89_31970 [Pseudonocardia sp.]
MEQELAAGEPVDVYVAPATRVSDARSGYGGPNGSNAAPPRLLWGDCDQELDRAKLAKLDPLIVNSGQPGHRHVYVPLNRSVSIAEHRVLNKALAAYLGCDTKWSDDALLRLPGTLNFKPTVPATGQCPGAARPVSLYKARASVWKVEKVAEILGVDLSSIAQNGAPTITTFVGSNEPPPDPLPNRVAVALRHADVSDRSKAHARLVGACLDAGFTIGQTVSVCATYPPSVDKYGTRLANEVARFWSKARTGRSTPTPCGSGGHAATPAADIDHAVDVDVHRLPNLPAEFWLAREVHQRIRTAAHSRLVSADLVLHGVLARVAAMRSHEMAFNSGRGRSSLNYFVGTVGASGTGKSTGGQVVDEVLDVPGYLKPNALEEVLFSDGLPIGSGEGIAEAFMGFREEEIGTTRKGDPITRRVRCMVRNNVFVTADEGEVFTRIGERKGSTIGSTLRSAWSGAAIGQTNGRDESTRVVAARSYALGLVVGFQPTTALPLLQDTATGMAQRFAWVSAVDPSIPDDQPNWPGELELEALVVAGERSFALARKGTIEFPQNIVDELTADHLAKVRGKVVVAERDSQAPLMRCKMAALMALLDGRFDKVSDEDWALAGLLWDTSCAVRDAVTDAATVEKSRQAESVAQARVQLAERQAAAVAGVPAKVDRLVNVLAARVLESGGMRRSEARRGMRSDERHLFDQVVERAAELELLRVVDGGGLLPLRRVKDEA